MEGVAMKARSNTSSSGVVSSLQQKPETNRFSASLLEAALTELVRDALREVIMAEVVPLVAKLPASIPNGKPEGGEYLTPREAAALAGVQPETIRDWVRKGRLKRNSAGRHLRIGRGDLVAYLTGGAGVLTSGDINARVAAVLSKTSEVRHG